ncbi:MAG: aminodeoxychorismate lyase [Thiohalomonadales bacterium]
MIKQLINGVLSQQLSILDRGLHYGDGLFETVLLHNSTIYYLPEHYQRLQDGCRRLDIPLASYDTIAHECRQLVADKYEGILKIIITRGDSERGYQYPPDLASRRIILLYPLPNYPSQNAKSGVKTHLCQTRLGRQPALAGLKHLCRLEHVLARSEWRDPSIAEGIMLDTAENVIEGTMSNIFIVENKTLVTPDLSQSGVRGILRQKIIDYAKILDISVRQEIIPINRLISADEVFICNSIIGIWPIIKIAEYSFDLGQLTVKLMNMLKNLPVKE